MFAQKKSDPSNSKKSARASRSLCALRAHVCPPIINRCPLLAPPLFKSWCPQELFTHKVTNPTKTPLFRTECHRQSFLRTVIACNNLPVITLIAPFNCFRQLTPHLSSRTVFPCTNVNKPLCTWLEGSRFKRKKLHFEHVEDSYNQVVVATYISSSSFLL